MEISNCTTKEKGRRQNGTTRPAHSLLGSTSVLHYFWFSFPSQTFGSLHLLAPCRRQGRDTSSDLEASYSWVKTHKRHLLLSSPHCLPLTAKVWTKEVAKGRAPLDGSQHHPQQTAVLETPVLERTVPDREIHCARQAPKVWFCLYWRVTHPVQPHIKFLIKPSNRMQSYQSGNEISIYSASATLFLYLTKRPAFMYIYMYTPFTYIYSIYMYIHYIYIFVYIHTHMLILHSLFYKHF